MGNMHFLEPEQLDVDLTQIDDAVVEHLAKMSLPDPTEESTFNLAHALKQSMHNQQKNIEVSIRDGYYHPSAFGYCLRAVAYERLGIPRKRSTDYEDVINLDLGTAIHETIQRYLQKAFPNIQIEVPVEDPILKIHGHADAVLPNRVVEIKSIRTEPATPLFAHLLQVTTYQAILNKPYWSLLYFVKSNSKLLSFDGTFDTKMWNSIVNVLLWVESLLAKKQLPPPEENYLYCKSCGWRYICKEEWPLIVKK